MQDQANRGESTVSTIQSDSKGKPIQASIAWLIAIFTAGYMLPWAIAATRGKSNAGVIGVVNLLLGWTVVGWVIALVMAAGSHQIVAAPAPVLIINQGMPQSLPYQAQPVIPGQGAPAIAAAVAPAGWFVQADGSHRWWDGAAWAAAAPEPVPQSVQDPIAVTGFADVTVSEPSFTSPLLHPVVDDAVLISDVAVVEVAVASGEHPEPA